MLLREITYSILELIREGSIVDDERLDVRLISKLVQAKRLEYIKSLADTNKILAEDFYQYFDLDIAGKLFPDAITLIVQLCATGVLFLGMKKLLWKPTQDYLAKRAEVADAALREAHEANVLARENQKKSDQLLSEAAHEAKQIIESGKLEGKRLKEQLLAEAKNEADNKLTSALREIAHQKAQMRDEIESEIVDVALLAASKLIEGKVDEAEDRKQIQHFIKDVRN